MGKELFVIVLIYLVPHWVENGYSSFSILMGIIHYCCITNYPQAQQLKDEEHYYLSWCQWVDESFCNV